MNTEPPDSTSPNLSQLLPTGNKRQRIDGTRPDRGTKHRDAFAVQLSPSPPSVKERNEKDGQNHVHCRCNGSFDVPTAHFVLQVSSPILYSYRGRILFGKAARQALCFPGRESKATGMWIHRGCRFKDRVASIALSYLYVL